MSLLFSLITIFILIGVVVGVALYFGLINVDDSAPGIAKFVNETRDHINTKIKEHV
jgi:hypothetical protein